MTYPAKLSVQHGFAYKEASQFAGWPANGGIWHWGDEILVRFQIGTHTENPGHGHAIARDKPSRQILARSRDGGETWQPEEIDVHPAEPGPIDFVHPDFAMQCSGSKFRISYDRGKTWHGDYDLPDIGKKLTARTDYLINDAGDCHFFLSAKEELVQDCMPKRFNPSADNTAVRRSASLKVSISARASMSIQRRVLN